MPVSNSVAPLSLHLNALFSCLTPPSQLTFYYLHSSYDPCAIETSNLKECFKAKVKSDEDEARRVMERVKVKDGRDMNGSGTRGKVWRFKNEGEKGWV